MFEEIVAGYALCCNFVVLDDEILCEQLWLMLSLIGDRRSMLMLLRTHPPITHHC
jgi:hypothetical protein